MVFSHREGVRGACVTGETMMLRLSTLFLAGALVLMGTGQASAYYELPGLFIPENDCQAFVSIKKETNPGDVTVVPGQTYQARALNKERGDWVHVDIPNASPQTRWVSLSCGDLYVRYGDDVGPGRPEPEEPVDDGVVSTFRPFFNNSNDGPQDYSPLPPTLTALDTAVLNVCGAWGSKPSKNAFRSMLDQDAVKGEVDQIYNSLNGTLRDQKLDLRAFKDEFSTIWFKVDGFAHIFCGEPSQGGIGGLHFAPRYLQLQQQGKAGLAERCNRAELVSNFIYTLGVQFEAPGGRIKTACPKGYGYNLDARELFIEATEGYNAMAKRTSGKAMCLERVAEGNYLAVFVIKDGGIRTFYPDASPSCDGNRPANTCLCSN